MLSQLSPLHQPVQMYPRQLVGFRLEPNTEKHLKATLRVLMLYISCLFSCRSSELSLSPFYALLWQVLSAGYCRVRLYECSLRGGACLSLWLLRASAAGDMQLTSACWLCYLQCFHEPHVTAGMLYMRKRLLPSGTCAAWL